MTQGFHHTMRNHHQLFFHRDIPVKAAQILTMCVSTTTIHSKYLGSFHWNIAMKEELMMVSHS